MERRRSCETRTRIVLAARRLSADQIELLNTELQRASEYHLRLTALDRPRAPAGSGCSSVSYATGYRGCQAHCDPEAFGCHASISRLRCRPQPRHRVNTVLPWVRPSTMATNASRASVIGMTWPTMGLILLTMMKSIIAFISSRVSMIVPRISICSTKIRPKSVWAICPVVMPLQTRTHLYSKNAANVPRGGTDVIDYRINPAWKSFV